MTSEFLALPGAVESAGIDTGIAAHYGNPLREQRTLAQGTSIVDLSNRAVLSVSGVDRLTWIDSITTQSIKRLVPGEATETLFLDPAGRLEHAAKLLDDGDTLWLLVEAGEASALLAWLLKMRFMLRVEPADRTAEFAVIGSMGDRALTDGRLIPATHNGMPLVWRDPWDHVTVGGHQYARGEHAGAEWNLVETLVPRAALAEVAVPSGEVSGGEASGSEVPSREVSGILALEALRIAAWRPRFAAEVDDRSIPHELDWLRSAVHLNKGCYRGQETVAKVHNLGHPPRRLVMLHLDGSDSVLPAKGDEVLLGGVVVGQVTSAALHYELGPIALAVIKRSTDADATLTVTTHDGLVVAAQEVIVPRDAGAVLGVPRLPRLGAVQR